MSVLTDENKTNRLMQNISLSLITFTGISVGYLVSDYVSTTVAFFIGFGAAMLSVIPIGYGFYYFSQEVQDKYVLKKKLKVLNRYKDDDNYVILMTDPNTHFVSQFHRNLWGVTLTNLKKDSKKGIVCKIFSNELFSSIYLKEGQRRFIILPKEKTVVRFYLMNNKKSEQVTEFILDDDTYDDFSKGIWALDNFLYDELLNFRKIETNMINKNK